MPVPVQVPVSVSVSAAVSLSVAVGATRYAGNTAHRGVPGLTLCRHRPPGNAPRPAQCHAGQPSRRDDPGRLFTSEGGRRRTISVVADLSRHPRATTLIV